jgi:hypothetical protein
VLEVAIVTRMASKPDSSGADRDLLGGYRDLVGIACPKRDICGRARGSPRIGRFPNERPRCDISGSSGGQDRVFETRFANTWTNLGKQLACGSYSKSGMSQDVTFLAVDGLTLASPYDSDGPKM